MKPKRTWVVLCLFVLSLLLVGALLDEVLVRKAADSSWHSFRSFPSPR